MRQAPQRRLLRLEKRRPKDAFAHLTLEQLQGRIDDLLVQIVEDDGLEAAREGIARECPPEALARLDVLQAQGRIRTD